jgi:hypothetical protein
MWWTPSSSGGSSGANVDPSGARFWIGPLASVGGSAGIPANDTAYWQYIGLTSAAFTPQHVQFRYTGFDSSPPTSPTVALASTPSAPNRAGQTLTVLEAKALPSLGSSTIYQNTTAFSTSVPAGTHLWIGFRWATAGDSFSGAVPNIQTGLDLGQGALLVTSGSGALTTSSTYTGARRTYGIDGVHPLLVLTLD